MATKSLINPGEITSRIKGTLHLWKILQSPGVREKLILAAYSSDAINRNYLKKVGNEQVFVVTFAQAKDYIEHDEETGTYKLKIRVKKNWTKLLLF